jgi:hypothetical protein
VIPVAGLRLSLLPTFNTPALVKLEVAVAPKYAPLVAERSVAEAFPAVTRSARALVPVTDKVPSV